MPVSEAVRKDLVSHVINQIHALDTEETNPALIVIGSRWYPQFCRQVGQWERGDYENVYLGHRFQYQTHKLKFIIDHKDSDMEPTVFCLPTKK